MNEIGKKLVQGMPLYKALNIPFTTLNIWVVRANQLLANKNYKDAKDAYFFLTLMHSKELFFWIGLGMAEQLDHSIEEALDAYEMASACDIYNPYPYFYLAKCFFSLHERKSALEAIATSIELSQNKPEFKEIYLQSLEIQTQLLHQ